MIFLPLLEAFLSFGGVVSFDARGPSAGIEVSAGGVEFGAFAGVALGASVELDHLQRGRVYVELEGGWGGAGVGYGPALLFGEDASPAWQLTAFASVSNVLHGECDTGPVFLVASPFYRYTKRPGGGAHGGGLFVKGLLLQGAARPVFEDSCNT